MEDTTVPTALYVLGAIGGLSVICIGVLIAVLQSPDVAALAVLASIASGAEGGTLRARRDHSCNASFSASYGRLGEAAAPGRGRAHVWYGAVVTFPVGRTGGIG